MSRKRGQPAYPGKSVNGSHYLTKEIALRLERASEALRRSESDIIEHSLRTVLPSLDREARLIPIADEDKTGTFGLTPEEVATIRQAVRKKAEREARKKAEKDARRSARRGKTAKTSKAMTTA